MMGNSRGGSKVFEWLARLLADMLVVALFSAVFGKNIGRAVADMVRHRGRRAVEKAIGWRDWEPRSKAGRFMMSAIVLAAWGLALIGIGQDVIDWLRDVFS